MPLNCHVFFPVKSCHFVLFSLDWLHVWQRCVLCWHGVQECELLSHLPIWPCRPPAAGRGCPRQHVSEIWVFQGMFDQSLFVSTKYVIKIKLMFHFFECRHELKKASHITKLPKSKHSVKGEKQFYTTVSGDRRYFGLMLRTWIQSQIILLFVKLKWLW